jgi:hypothetical protein
LTYSSGYVISGSNAPAVAVAASATDSVAGAGALDDDIDDMPSLVGEVFELTWLMRKGLEVKSWR